MEVLKDAYLTTTGSEDPLDFSGYISGWSGGWSMSTRDLARVGYLVLRNGAWNGQQVIPALFVNDLYQNQIPPAAKESPDRSDAFYNEYPIGTPDLPGGYSFGFWLPHKSSIFGGSRSVTEAVAMSGAFGTTVFISRATDLVIAAVNTSQGHQEGKIPGAVLDLFAGAIINNPPPPSPSFTLTTGSSSRILPMRSGASQVINVVPANGFTGDVSFSVSGLPAGASASFSPPSVNTAGFSTMTVSWGAGVPAGIYQLAVTGVGGSLRQTISVTLAVGRAPIVRSQPRTLRVP